MCVCVCVCVCDCMQVSQYYLPAVPEMTLLICVSLSLQCDVGFARAHWPALTALVVTLYESPQ